MLKDWIWLSADIYHGGGISLLSGVKQRFHTQESPPEGYPPKATACRGETITGENVGDKLDHGGSEVFLLSGGDPIMAFWNWSKSFIKRHPYLSMIEAVKGGIIIGLLTGYFLWY